MDSNKSETCSSDSDKAAKKHSSHEKNSHSAEEELSFKIVPNFSDRTLRSYSVPKREDSSTASSETMDASASGPAGNNDGSGAPNERKTNPQSIEMSYKKKCIEMKKRLNEVEELNDTLIARNLRGRRYVQKMRLESCILLERVAALMNDQDPTKVNPELRAQLMALMEQNGGALPLGDNGVSASASGLPGEASEGSGEDRPPTPQERPLRPKRSRKPEEGAGAENGSNENNTEPVSSTLLPLLPAIGPHSPAAGYDPSGPVSMNPYTPHGGSARASAGLVPRASAGSGLASSPLRSHAGAVTTSPFTPIASSAPGGGTGHGHGQPQHHQHHHNLHPPSSTAHRYVSAFEDFTNRNRERISSALQEAFGPGTQLSDSDIDRALREHWEGMEPEEKRQYGDRNGGKRNGV